MLDKNEKFTSYSDMFIMFSCLVEKWLKRMIAILLISLILFQFLLQSAEVRYYITTIGRLEGEMEAPNYRE